MAGLGSVQEKSFIYLSIAGGFIWNKKLDKNDPDYGEQTFNRADGTEGKRTGAMYNHIEGIVRSVQFKQHTQYGESINVTIDIGKETNYVISVSTNNRYSQDLMKALLLANLDENIYIKPYDFVGSDQKRASGITFKQDGKKLELKIDEAPSKTGDWFKSATKKAIKRFFEDLNDWYVAQVEELIVPKLDASPHSTKKVEVKEEKDESNLEEEVKTEVVEKEKPKDTDRPSPIKMKRAIKAYMAENYEDEDMPKLSGETLIKWYDLVQAEEELPIETEVEVDENVDKAEAEVEGADLDSEIDALMG